MGCSLRIRCKYVFDSFHSLGDPFCLWIFILSLVLGKHPWHGKVKGPEMRVDCEAAGGFVGGMEWT